MPEYRVCSNSKLGIVSYDSLYLSSWTLRVGAAQPRRGRLELSLAVPGGDMQSLGRVSLARDSMNSVQVLCHHGVRAEKHMWYGLGGRMLHTCTVHAPFRYYGLTGVIMLFLGMT